MLKRYFKKVIMLAVGISIILSVFATVTPASAQEKITVTYWHGWTGRWTGVVEDFCKLFMKSFPNIEMKPLVIPYSEMNIKLLTGIATGNPPDLITIGGLFSLVLKDAVLSYEELLEPGEKEKLKEWLVPVCWDWGVYEGKLYALKLHLNPYATFYNKKLFQEAGLDPDKPPKTTEEFDRCAERLTTYDSRGNIDRMGFLPGDIVWWGPVFGGNFYDKESRKVTANDSGIVKALEWFASYSKKYGVEKVTAFKAGLAEERAEAFEPFIAEKVAMYLNGPWKIDDIALFAPKDFSYGVSLCPAPPGGHPDAMTMAGGTSMVIPRGAKHPKGALQFIKFWAGWPPEYVDQSAQINLWGGWIPPAPVVAQSSIYAERFKKYPQLRVFEQIMNSPHITSVPKLVEARFLDRVRTAEEYVLLLKKTPQQALDDCTDEVQKALDKVLKK